MIVFVVVVAVELMLLVVVLISAVVDVVVIAMLKYKQVQMKFSVRSNLKISYNNKLCLWIKEVSV